jgi:hypothetical protein
MDAEWPLVVLPESPALTAQQVRDAFGSHGRDPAPAAEKIEYTLAFQTAAATTDRSEKARV